MSNETEFDWYKVLDKAIESEPTFDYYLNLRKRAGDWVTCACGQLCSRLPRSENGQPKDTQLFSLGRYFLNQVEDSSWIAARTILDQIEARTAHLLANTTL